MNQKLLLEPSTPVNNQDWHLPASHKRCGGWSPNPALVTRGAPPHRREGHTPAGATRQTRGMCPALRSGHGRLPRSWAWRAPGGGCGGRRKTPSPPTPATHADAPTRPDTGAAPPPRPPGLRARPVPPCAAAPVLGGISVQKPVFLCCSARLDRCEGVGHILRRQSAKRGNVPRTHRPGDNQVLGGDTEKGALSPHPPPRNPPSLPRLRSASRGRVPIQTRGDLRPRRQPRPCRGCLRGSPLPWGAPDLPTLSAQASHPSPGDCPRGPLPAPGPGPTCGWRARPLPLPRPRAHPRGASLRRHAGRALRSRAEPPPSVSQTPRPPAGAGDRFPAAGWLARRGVGAAVGALPPREPGGRLTRGSANGRPRRRGAGPRAEVGGACAPRRGLPCAAASGCGCGAERGKLLLGSRRCSSGDALGIALGRIPPAPWRFTSKAR